MKVLHAHKEYRGALGGTVNTTLCGRMSLGNEGMNKADTLAEITCKLCKRRLGWALVTAQKHAEADARVCAARQSTKDKSWVCACGACTVARRLGFVPKGAA